jgi:transcriptional regulator with XRE-family HTH domain
VEHQRAHDEQVVLQAWGDVLRRYRIWQRLSRRELAQRAGLSPVFLGEIERGEKDPSSHSICLVARALDVPLAELYVRVATRLDRNGDSSTLNGQPSLPLGWQSRAKSISRSRPAKDATAFDLYRIARLLRGDQQVSLVLLAQSLLPGRR